MGAWGFKLYDSDTASDLRDQFKDWRRLPYNGDELLAFIGEQTGGADDPADEDYTTYWLTLADLFWRHGIGCAALFRRAASIVESGDDDRMMADLEMEEKDRTKRRKHLLELNAKWAAPNPKPARRNVFKKPEPLVVATGDVWIYPTEGGNPPNTFFPAAELAQSFKPDGWAAFAVTNTTHLLGFLAAAHFVRLHVDGPDKPTFEDCVAAPLSGAHYFMMRKSDPLAHAAGVAEITRTVLTKMRAERVGSVDISWEKVCARVNEAENFHQTRHRGTLCGLLSIYQPMLVGKKFMDYAKPLDVKFADLII